MTVKVLGPLDTGTEPLSPRERAILAALIVRQGTAMTPGELAEAYWGEQVPQTWGQQVKTSIARIRVRLGKESVATRGSEYALGIDLDVIDAVRFERLVSAARQHALHGESDRAVDGYRRALALWRGAAYPELSSWEPGVVEAMRLDEIRRSAEEELVEARLRTGDQRPVIADAERLVREQPLREARWAILALANYQAGRQGEALATLRAARERLLDELGIEPGTRLIELETAILRQDQSLAPDTTLSRVSQECPYRGLSAYGPDDADAYFGRDADIEEVLARTVAGAIVTIAGPSGSGKSSLVLAGVVPRLRERGRRIEIMRPGAASLSTLRWMSQADAAPDVLVIDQAEELLAVDGGELETFCEVTAKFLLGRGTVVLTIRSDFLDRAAALPFVGQALARGIYLLGPLSPAALRDAIVEPAHAAGLRIEPGLVELVLRDAGDRSTILPLLSHGMQETWVRREGATLTVEGYESSGGIAGAIAQSAEQLFQSLSPHDRELCRSTMLRLIERGEDGSSVRRRAAVAPLLEDGDRRRVIDLLASARLVAIDGDAIMVAHESVSTAWPRLDAWLEEDAAGARIARTLETSASAWQAAGGSDDDLLRGARLQSAAEWRAATSPDLTAVESDYLDRSAAREQNELTAVSVRAARDRRQNRSLRWALGGAAMLLVVALVSGGIAVLRGRDAAAAAEDSLVEAITARSISLRPSNRDIAALMAVEAHRRWPDDPRTRAALMDSMTAAGAITGVTYLDEGAWRSGIYPIADTNRVVVAQGTTVRVNDLDTGAVVSTLSTDLAPSDQTWRPWVRVSADGSTAVVLQHIQGLYDRSSDDREIVSFFDLASGGQIGDAIDVTVGSETVSVSRDGRYASWAWPGTLVVVERDTGVVHRTDAFVPRTPFEGTRAVSAFTAAGTVLIGNLDGDVWEVAPTTFAEIAHWKVPAGYTEFGMAATDDGTVFASGREGIIATDAAGRELWRHRFERDAECSRIAATSSSGVAACGDENGTFQVRDLWTGEVVVPATSYQLGASGDLAFVDGGREMLLLSATAPAVGRARVDGAGPASHVIAAGMTIDGGFDSEASQVLVESIANAQLGAREQPSFAAWDIAADSPTFRIPEDVTDPFDGVLVGMRWITDDLVLTWQLTWDSPQQKEPDETARLLDLTTGRFVTSGIPEDAADVFSSKVPGRVLIATRDADQMMAIDKQSLQPVGEPRYARPNLLTLSDTADGTHFVETRWNSEKEGPETRVVDATTGEVVVSGLPTQQASIGLANGDVLAADASSLSVFSGTDLSPVRRLPVSVGWAATFALSDDGKTLLARGFGEHAFALVDMHANLALGDSMPDRLGWGQPTLAADGSAFALPGASGVLLWSLRADDQIAAACRLAGRDLTADEWATYLGDLGAQRPICEGFPD